MAGEKHLRLQIHGDTVSASALGGEVWACNIRLALVFGGVVDDVALFPSNWNVDAEFASHTETDWDTTTTWRATNGPLVFEPTDYITNQVMPVVKTWMEQPEHHGIVRCKGVSLYPCSAPSGNSIGGNVATGLFHTPVPGGGSGNPLPLENSVVLSWGTNKIGPRGKGRIYSPVGPVSILNSLGVVESTKLASYLSAAVALVAGLKLDAGVGTGARAVRPVVTGPSTGGGVGPYQGYATIKTVRVGEVVDTQRRRRNKEPELYISAPSGL